MEWLRTTSIAALSLLTIRLHSGLRYIAHQLTDLPVILLLLSNGSGFFFYRVFIIKHILPRISSSIVFFYT